ncbi:MAG TPA: hypothetical protein VLA61_10500 [Ideonella sp.]|nr:hypothetical protein [Ideonella sp.]HSI48691.1 hypothetical protein [Ideonella sp.]
MGDPKKVGASPRDVGMRGWIWNKKSGPKAACKGLATAKVA